MIDRDARRQDATAHLVEGVRVEDGDASPAGGGALVGEVGGDLDIEGRVQRIAPERIRVVVFDRARLADPDRSVAERPLVIGDHRSVFVAARQREDDQARSVAVLGRPDDRDREGAGFGVGDHDAFGDLRDLFAQHGGHNDVVRSRVAELHELACPVDPVDGDVRVPIGRNDLNAHALSDGDASTRELHLIDQSAHDHPSAQRSRRGVASASWHAPQGEDVRAGRRNVADDLPAASPSARDFGLERICDFPIIC